MEGQRKMKITLVVNASHDGLPQVQMANKLHLDNSRRTFDRIGSPFTGKGEFCINLVQREDFCNSILYELVRLCSGN